MEPGKSSRDRLQFSAAAHFQKLEANVTEMINRGRHNLLGVMISAVDYEFATAQILDRAKTRRPLALSALAVHGVMTGVLDLRQRYRLNSLDLLVPDGQPVRWALNLVHRTHLPDRVYGPTLMLETCRAAEREELGIYLYGSQRSTIDRLQDRLRRLFPQLQITGSSPSRFRKLTPGEGKKVVDEVRASGAAITFIGLGCPRQETFAYELTRSLSMPALCVGAAFDFHAGTLPQAPSWMQTCGLEWAFRLAHEPRRLWRRHLLLNPVFLAMTFLQALRLLTLKPGSAERPRGHDLPG